MDSSVVLPEVEKSVGARLAVTVVAPMTFLEL